MSMSVNVSILRILSCIGAIFLLLLKDYNL